LSFCKTHQSSSLANDGYRFAPPILQVSDNETTLDIRPRSGYILRISLIEGAFPEGMPEGWSGSGPRGRNCQSAPGRLRASSRPALRPVREVLAALAPGRVLPFAPGNSRKRGPELSHRGQSLGECRSGAPEGERAPTFGALPRPAHCRTVTSGSVARTLVGCASRRSAPLFMSRGRT
jgi:hypothetical protein